MLKRLVNEARFTLTITTTGPVLVMSGHATQYGPDMTPVLTHRDGEWQVYLPGSSLKGVIRSHLEKVSRTLKTDPPVVCNPFWKLEDRAKVQGRDLVCPDYHEVFCGNKFLRRGEKKFTLDKKTWRREEGEEKITSDIAYRDSCPICRLFGSTEFIGRVSINDAYLKDQKGRKESRDCVAIDRLTGGVAEGPFELEVVSSDVAFETEVYLRNFETWQLGMLLVAVQDLEDGLIRVGSDTSRGLGSVTGGVNEVSINYLGLMNGKPAEEVWGLGKLQSEGERKAYRTWPDDVLTVNPSPTEERRGIRLHTTFRDESLDVLRQQALDAFVERLQGWKIPDSMTLEYLGYGQ
jgi:CRISPR-associated RAMP protein (TIGR02581 family)